MLSIKECRQILKQTSKNLSDEQVEQVRAFLYNMALIELDNFRKIKSNEQRSHLYESVNGWAGGEGI